MYGTNHTTDTNKQLFLGAVHKFIRTRQKILLKSEDKNCPQIVHQLFLSYFSFCSQQDTNNTNARDYSPNEILLSELTNYVKNEDATNCLNALDITKASGPDEILTRLLKACSNDIAPSLCSLCNRTLSSG